MTERCQAHYHKADAPDTMYCVLAKGHDGECDYRSDLSNVFDDEVDSAIESEIQEVRWRRDRLSKRDLIKQLRTVADFIDDPKDVANALRKLADRLEKTK